MKIHAPVLRDFGRPMRIEDLDLMDPQNGEVLVKIVSAAVCGTDVHAVQGYFSPPMPLPVVLGHEGAGIVEKVGPGVTKVQPGDHVVLSAIISCGNCVRCFEGDPWACELFNSTAFHGVLPGGVRRLSKDGEPVNHFFAQSSFGTFAVATEGSTIKVPNNAPLEKLSPLGCSVQTGAGAAMNTVKRGTSVAIFGCGGVGLSAVMGARLVGASKIIAIDILDSRLNLATEFGATHTVNASQTDPVRAVIDITGVGADYTIEVVGKPDVIFQAIDSSRYHGTTVLVGSAHPGTKLTLDFSGQLFRKTIRSCNEGFANSRVFIPLLLELHEQGRLPFDKLSPRTYSQNEVNEALVDAAKGSVLKPIILM